MLNEIPAASQAVTLVAFNIDATTRSAAQATLVSFKESYASSGAIGNNPTFGSTGTLRGAALIDTATGHLLGFATPIGPYFRADGPPITAYDLAGHDTIAALLGQMPQPAEPGVTTLQGEALQAARLTIGLKASAPLFMQASSGPQGAYTPNGFAVVLGATATATILAASYLPGMGSPAIVVTRHDGTIAAITPTLVASDSATTLAFFSVPKLDMPIPKFGGAPPAGTTVAIPRVDGFSCQWSAPAPPDNECPLAIGFQHVVAPPASNPTSLGVTTPANMVIDTGAPVIDPRTGAIVALNGVGGIAFPMSIIALKADALNVGIHMTIGP